MAYDPALSRAFFLNALLELRTRLRTAVTALAQQGQLAHWRLLENYGPIRGTPLVPARSLTAIPDNLDATIDRLLLANINGHEMMARLCQSPGDSVNIIFYLMIVNSLNKWRYRQVITFFAPDYGQDVFCDYDPYRFLEVYRDGPQPLLQRLADVFNAEVVTLKVAEGAAYGAALGLRLGSKLLTKRFAWTCLALFGFALMSLGPVDASRHPTTKSPAPAAKP